MPILRAAKEGNGAHDNSGPEQYDPGRRVVFSVLILETGLSGSGQA